MEEMATSSSSQGPCSSTGAEAVKRIRETLKNVSDLVGTYNKAKEDNVKVAKESALKALPGALYGKLFYLRV